MQLTKEQKFGIISSIIFLTIFIGVLMFFGFSRPYPPPEEEGILINFGTDNNGLGDVEPKPMEQQTTKQESKVIPKPISKPKTITKDVSNNTKETLTQDFDKTAFIEQKKRKEKEAKRKEEAEKEKKRLEELKEQKRIKELEEQKELERLKKEQQKKAIENRAKNAFGGRNNSGDNKSEGNSSGNGNQGRIDGDINSKNINGNSSGGNGVSFSLNGRSSKSLPSPPKIHNTEGKVVVEVTVDQNGNVIKARAGVRGTTISNEQLLKVAREAALKASFDVNKNAPALQKGTITYYFEFE